MFNQRNQLSLKQRQEHTIAPGANQTVDTHAGNVTTYADKLVIKRNGNVVTTFTHSNHTSPWVKEASAANVTGIVGTNNGITVAAGTFNPADTISSCCNTR